MNEESMTHKEILKQISAIPGGYEYWGCNSVQLCFPLKKGGELRFMISDDGDVGFDYYDGMLPPCITGPSFPTARDL